MLADDRPDYPMCFFLRMEFSGRMERSSLEAALTKALAQNQMMQVNLYGDSSQQKSKLFWRPTESVILPQIVWQDVLPEEDAFAVTPIDLTREIGIRLFVQLEATSTKIQAQIHHAISDALGAVKFMEDVMRFYGPSDLQLHSKSLMARNQLLPTRGDFYQTAQSLRRRLVRDVSRTLLFFRNFPQAIAIPHQSLGPRTFPKSHSAEITPFQLTAFRKSAKCFGATINDLMLRDLFLTIGDWHTKLNPNKPSPTIRIAMPINMRQRNDSDMSAANLVSMCFIDRSAAILESPVNLLSTIVTETSQIKQQFLGYTLLRVLSILSHFKGGLTWMTTPKLLWKCSATAVLSNLGEPLKNSDLPRNDDGKIRTGDLVLEKLELLPPIRPFTHVAFGVVTYNHKMFVTIHYNARLFTAKQGQELLESLVTKMKTTISITH